MKKTYMIPTLKVIKIQPSHFIATSQNADMNGDPITDPDDFGARRSRFSTWEDDWEE